MPFPYRSIREWVQDEEKLGNVLRIKAPIKCGDYSNIVDIGPGIPGKQPETQVRATVRYLHTLPGKPIGFIERPVNNRPDIPVILNPWPSRERVLRGLNLKTKDEFCQKLMDINSHRIKPARVSRERALCKQVVLRENEIDLRRDIARCWIEFNQVLWSTCNSTVIIYDPATGTHDLGKLRTGQYEWHDADPSKPFPLDRITKYMFSTILHGTSQSSNAGRYYESCCKKGTPMPAALVLGLPTDIHIVGALRSFRWPGSGDEYELVGALRGEPVEVVAAETIPGLMVPADAEWVFEGEFLAEEETMPPFAEDIASGYTFGNEKCPVFRVKCITHRKDPWWDATTFSSSGSTSGPLSGAFGGHEGPHTGLQFLNCEPVAINFLRGLGFKIKDVVVVGGGREVAIVQTELDGADKPMPHWGMKILMALHGNPGFGIGPATKYMIAVGPDINPYDLNDVMWALGTRSMPVSDSIMIEKGLCGWGDPGGLADKSGWKAYGEQMMIDALVKVPERYTSFPLRAEPAEWEKAAIERVRQVVEKARESVRAGKQDEPKVVPSTA